MSHILDYQHELATAVASLDETHISKAADILFEAWRNKRSVWIFGNGGSWSTAEHFACDLRKWSRLPGSGGVRAHALTLTSLATAYANDHAYHEIFARQLNDVMELGDVAVGITCGGSKNVMDALHWAVKKGKRIALGSPRWYWAYEPPAEVVIFAEADDIRIQEDIHLAVCHILAGEVKERIAALRETPRVQVQST